MGAHTTKVSTKLGRTTYNRQRSSSDKLFWESSSVERNTKLFQIASKYINYPAIVDYFVSGRNLVNPAAPNLQAIKNIAFYTITDKMRNRMNSCIIGVNTAMGVEAGFCIMLERNERKLSILDIKKDGTLLNIEFGVLDRDGFCQRRIRKSLSVVTREFIE